MLDEELLELDVLDEELLELDVLDEELLELDVLDEELLELDVLDEELLELDVLDIVLLVLKSLDVVLLVLEELDVLSGLGIKLARRVKMPVISAPPNTNIPASTTSVNLLISCCLFPRQDIVTTSPYHLNLILQAIAKLTDHRINVIFYQFSTNWKKYAIIISAPVNLRKDNKTMRDFEEIAEDVSVLGKISEETLGAAILFELLPVEVQEEILFLMREMLHE